MLPKKNRIPRTLFPTDHRQGFRVFSPLFSGVIYRSQAGSRVTVVVSKKISKSAVVRNHTRRQWYEAVSSLLKGFTRDALLVVYPKKEALTVPFVDIQKELESSLRNAKLLS